MNRVKQRIATHKARKAKGKRKHERDFYYGYWQSSIRERKRKQNRWARGF